MQRGKIYCIVHNRHLRKAYTTGTTVVTSIFSAKMSSSVSFYTMYVSRAVYDGEL